MARAAGVGERPLRPRVVTRTVHDPGGLVLLGVRAEGGADLPGAASGAGTSAAAAEEPEDLGTRAGVAHAEAGWAVAHPPHVPFTLR